MTAPVTEREVRELSTANERKLGGTGFYFPELDGVRALAFFLVFMFHSWVIVSPNKHDFFSETYNKISTWGFLGVDLFFVLSGFLITSILLREKVKTGSISLPAFYARRGLRILPVYWLVILTAAVIVPLCSVRHLNPAMYSQFATSVLIPASCMVVNFTLLFTEPLLRAFSTAVHFPLFQLINPLWSVCIEEHFYLGWPLLLKRLSTPSALIKFSLCAIAASFALSLYGGLLVATHDSGPLSSSNIYYSNTFARLYSLLFGALLSTAFIYNKAQWQALGRHSNLVAILTSVGAAGLIFGCNADFKSAGMPVALFASGILSTGLIFSALESASVKRFFSWFPFVEVGKLTYGMYLIHYPIIVIVGQAIKKYVGESWGYTGYSLKFSISLILTFAIAKVIFWALESRMLALRKRFVRT